jgi:RNase adapter protein RapZ
MAGHLVIVTGVSGAGKSTALRSLEDQGFFCVDNLPTVLAPEVVNVCAQGGLHRVALGIDVRVGTFLGTIGSVLDTLSKTPESRLDVIFCDASDEAILRRFSETRRPHALAAEGTGAFAVLDGLRVERARLTPLRARATCLIDTTHLSVHDLRRRILEQFADTSRRRMAVKVISFGFKYGIPVDADVVLDVRFLSNPYFVQSLKPLSGLEAPVRDYVLALPESVEFLAKSAELLAYMIPLSEREGKSYLTIAIGCTGGRHRSVAIAEELAHRLGGVPAHRDVTRADGKDPGTTGRFSMVEELKMQISPLPGTVGVRPEDKK